MKKILFICFCLFGVLAFSQSKYTVEQVEKSNDPKVVANFVKYNPDHPRTPEFKAKLYRLAVGSSSSSGSSTSTKTSSATVSNQNYKPATSNKSTTASKSSSSTNNSSSSTDYSSQKTVDLLNHMFNSDPTSKEAYVQIENKSKCSLVVKFSGKKNYTLNVPAKAQNFILIDKGTYNISSNVCSAKYSSKKAISKDLMIALNSPE